MTRHWKGRVYDLVEKAIGPDPRKPRKDDDERKSKGNRG